MKLNSEKYEPIDGFFDLRNFDLTKTEFQSAWNIQKFLKQKQDTRNSYKKYNAENPHQQKIMGDSDWQKALELSAELQMFLLPKLKPNCELA